MIFLRATYTQLTKAGFEDLDPKHELFLLYRPKEGEELISDVSVLSPRYKQAASEMPWYLKFSRWVATQVGMHSSSTSSTPRYTPRALALPTSVLSNPSSPVVLANRARPESHRISARLAELGSPGRREERAQQRRQQNDQIDERMDKRADDGGLGV